MTRTKQRVGGDYGSLREWREAKRLTQAAAARVLDVDRSTLAHMENGRIPGGRLAMRLANRTGVPVQAILGA